jgi:hypothetical protein
MDAIAIKQEFQHRVSDQIDLQPEGVDRFAILTPFRFDDGDHYDIALKREGDRWVITDEASTLMHLSYWMDDKALEAGPRQEIVANALSLFSVENRNGEFIIPVTDDNFGDALFNFLQAITKVTDVSYLSREIVKSTFLEDFRQFMRENVPPERLEFDWHNPQHDPAALYPVDCRVNSMKRPMMVFALQSEEKVQIAHIDLLTFERWGTPFQSLAIYENMEAVPPKPVARFTDVVEKAYSTLGGNKERIAAFLRQRMTEQ